MLHNYGYRIWAGAMRMRKIADVIMGVVRDRVPTQIFSHWEWTCTRICGCDFRETDISISLSRLHQPISSREEREWLRLDRDGEPLHTAAVKAATGRSHAALYIRAKVGIGIPVANDSCTDCFR